MATLEEQFNTRPSAFPSWPGMGPTTLGTKAVGDPSLLRQIARGRSPSLRTADRVLAFIAACELDSGGARAPPARPDGPRPATRARKTERSGSMTEPRGNEPTKPRTRFLRVSAVAARTGLSRSTIYRWSAEGRFPPPIRLGGRVVRWVEAEEWIRERMEKSRGGDAPAASSGGRRGFRGRRQR